MTIERSVQHHETSQTTPSPQELAKLLGFQRIDALAQYLPHESRVLHFGAGASELGDEVVFWRRDIEWTNADPRYDEVTQTAESGVESVKYGVQDLLNNFGEGAFSHIYVHEALKDITDEPQALEGLKVLCKSPTRVRFAEHLITDQATLPPVYYGANPYAPSLHADLFSIGDKGRQAFNVIGAVTATVGILAVGRTIKRALSR